MARASRSNKKQPAFDPSELQDLIFSPAVGSGVGSHLLGGAEEFRAPIEIPEESSSNISTVDTSNMSTVDGSAKATVDRLRPGRTTGMRSATSIGDCLPIFRHALTNPDGDLTTVDDIKVSTVDRLESKQHTTIANNLDVTTVVNEGEPIVVTSSMSAVEGADSTDLRATDQVSNIEGREGLPAVKYDSSASREEIAAVTEPSTRRAEIQTYRTPKEVVLWITEQGDLVPPGRVKRIRLAQDVINSAEESVYDTLWAAKSQTDDRDSSRVVQAGYDYLVKRTRLSKKTIQRIVAKLIDKDFIAIEHPADIYQRTSTVYRVFSYKAVLDRHVQRGRSHVAKIGPGFSYVRPMEDPRQYAMSTARFDNPIATNLIDMSTVDTSDSPTVVKTFKPTEANETTDTVARSDTSTVVRTTTTLIGKDLLGQTTSSSSLLYKTLNQYGAVDDDIVHRLLKSCKQQAPDCTDEEIAHFIEEKGSLVRVRDSRIYSPIGFLLTAVPKCLSGEAFRLYREAERERRDAEAEYEARRQAELDEWRLEQEARLADPNVSEQDKLFIRKYFRDR